MSANSFAPHIKEAPKRNNKIAIFIMVSDVVWISHYQNIIIRVICIASIYSNNYLPMSAPICPINHGILL